tara:strand:+ start:144 stop:1070 length:927 start_codon:yes stop_codon:yes gene_type:complete
MKKLLPIIFLSFIFLTLNFEAKAKKYKINEVVENKFYFNKRFIMNLPEGKWTVIGRYNQDYYGIRGKVYTLVRIENKTILESIEIGEMNTAGIFPTEISHAIYEVIFKDKYDGCYERPEYYLVKVFKKGSTHNCIVIGHSDVYRDFFTPDDPDATNASIKKWIRDNKIQLPKVGLTSFHAYYSRLVKGKWYLLNYGIDPNILNAPKNNFISEESSEYHKNNISKYPEHQKIMDRWVSISAQRHLEFENIVEALDAHKLDLNNLLPLKSLNSENLSSDIVDQINKLNNLYKNGALTKDEFEKAKKKLLN